MKYERLTLVHPNGFITYNGTKQPPNTPETEELLTRLAVLEDKVENGTLREYDIDEQEFYNDKQRKTRELRERNRRGV